MEYQPPVSPTPIASTPSAKPIAPTPDYWKAAEKAANSRAPQWMSEMPSSHPGMDTFNKLPSMVDVMGKEYVRPQTVFSSGIGRDGVRYSEPSAKVIPGYTREVVVGRAVVRPVAAPTIGSQVGSGALKALPIVNIVGIGHNGLVDYNNGIEKGESQFRSGTNAVAGMGGAFAGGAAGAKLGGLGGAAAGSAIPGVGTAVGGVVGSIGGGIIGSIGGSGITGWLSDRVLDLFGGLKGIPNPNGASGNPFSPGDPFGAPRVQTPQPNGSNPGPPPGGGGIGSPTGQGTKPLNPTNPLFPLLPWLPDWKMPRMPWDPPAPSKPSDPKKPDKPGNPGTPNPGKPGPQKPGQPPQTLVPGLWQYSSFGETRHWGYEAITNWTYPGYASETLVTIGFPGDEAADDPSDRRVILALNKFDGTQVNLWAYYPSEQTAAARFIPTPTPENTPKKKPPSRQKPGTPPSPPGDQSRPGQPNSPQFPGLNPSQNPTSPGIPAPFMGGNQGGYFPGLYLNPNYTPPKNNGNPEKKPGIPPGSETSPDGTPRFPGFRPDSEPTLNPAPSTAPAVNQPGVNIPQPWTNPFFPPSSLSNGGSQTISPLVNPGKLQPGELNTGELNTGDQSGNTRWNPETKKYEPTFPNVTNPSQIKAPATPQNPSNPPGAPPKTSFQSPPIGIPSVPNIPAAAKIPDGAIPKPITNPTPTPTPNPAPSTSCKYVPDLTVSVGLASYNPSTNTISYTPTVVSASNAAAFQHLAQETANMRKEVSGIHKVLEVDLYRSPTGKIVAPKAECELLQGVMSVSPLAAVPLVKTLPQEMKVLAAMNHMYSGHHLLGNIKVSSNPANATAATYAPLTAVGMQFALYNNVTSMIGLPNAVSTVNAQGQTIASPFLNSMDAIENVSATTQGLETDVSGLQEMVFKVLQNQDILVNMVHKETFKTEVLIKDSGCRTTEIPVERPSVMSHGNAKTPVKNGFNWLNVFKNSTVYTNVPVWKGDIDKQQLGLKTNMEAQKANTSVYFPIADKKEDSKLPKLQTRPKKGNEFNRFVKTLNETPPSQGDTPSIYDGPGMPKAKLEEVVLGNVKKIVVEADVEFIGVSPPLAGVKKGVLPK